MTDTLQKIQDEIDNELRAFTRLGREHEDVLTDWRDRIDALMAESEATSEPTSVAEEPAEHLTDHEVTGKQARIIDAGNVTIDVGAICAVGRVYKLDEHYYGYEVSFSSSETLYLIDHADGGNLKSPWSKIGSMPRSRLVAAWKAYHGQDD